MLWYNKVPLIDGLRVDEAHKGGKGGGGGPSKADIERDKIATKREWEIDDAKNRWERSAKNYKRDYADYKSQRDSKREATNRGGIYNLIQTDDKEDSAPEKVYDDPDYSVAEPKEGTQSLSYWNNEIAAMEDNRQKWENPEYTNKNASITNTKQSTAKPKRKAQSLMTPLMASKNTLG